MYIVSQGVLYIHTAADDISYLRASVVISTQTIGQKQLQFRTAMPFGRIGPPDVMYIYILSDDDIMGVKPARIRFYRFRNGERETYHGFTTVPFLISFFLIYFRINRVVSGKRSGGALNGVLIGAALCFPAIVSRKARITYRKRSIIFEKVRCSNEYRFVIIGLRCRNPRLTILYSFILSSTIETRYRYLLLK